ncbi:hypothetical protein TthTF19_20710 (plasmid) [Thermus thermophilus]
MYSGEDALPVLKVVERRKLAPLHHIGEEVLVKGSCGDFRGYNQPCAPLGVQKASRQLGKEGC